MTKNDANELFELASSICDECATTEQVLRLEQILDGNVEAQGLYAHYMALHSELYWQSDSLLAIRTPDEGTGFPVDGIRPASWFNYSSLIALAAMLLVGSGFGYWANHWGHQPVRMAQSAVEIGAATSSGDVVATVSGTRNCRWVNDADYASLNSGLSVGYGSPLYAGQNLRLVEGLVEITFKTGVKIIVEAPAALDLSSLTESVLHEGRMTAAVPKGAEGFQVVCRGITLIDRGTEFGVSSDNAGQTEVHVFSGLVDGIVKGANGSTLKKVSWKTDDAVRFSPTTNEFEAVEKSTRFVRSMTQSASGNQGLIAAEHFDYPVGPLDGQNGGFGWAGPWENISFANGKPESNGIGAGSLPIDGLEHLGNHASLSGQFNRIRRNLGTSFSGMFDIAGLIESQDGARLIGKDGTTLYFSFSQKVGKTDDVFYGFELNRGDGNSNRVLCIGHAAAKGWISGPPRTPNKAAGVTGWAVTSEFNGSDGRLLELGELGPETTEPIFIVVKIAFGRNNRDEVSVYLNPGSTVNEHDSQPFVTGRGNFAFDRIALANFEGDKSYDIDHVRFGTQFQAVAKSPAQSEFVSKVSSD